MRSWSFRRGAPERAAIVAGVVLQLLSVPIDGGIVGDGLHIAATSLVFSVGAKIERKPLQSYRRTALGLASMSLIVTAAVGALLWTVMDLDGWMAIQALGIDWGRGEFTLTVGDRPSCAWLGVRGPTPQRR